MNENYFVTERQKFQEQLKAKEQHVLEAGQLLGYVIGHCHNAIAQQVPELNQWLSDLQFQFSFPNNSRDDQKLIGETKVPCHGGQHSGVKFEELLIRSDPKRLSIQVMSGSTEIGSFKSEDLDAMSISRLLINHAFRCLRKKHKLDADISAG